MFLALSTCVLSISLLQLVNGAPFLNTTFLLLLFGLSASCATIDIVPLTSIYTSQ